MDAKAAYFYVLNDPDSNFSEAEQIILASKDPKWLCLYAIKFMNTRWVDAEPFIRTHPKWAYLYARRVVFGRWVEAEPVLRGNVEWACLYSVFVGKRWRELEPAFYKLPKHGELYHERFFSGIPFPHNRVFYLGPYEVNDSDDLDTHI
ncbi:MAG: hypothetical protein HYX68_13960 [Planctomycetes bacterium]|nr:hypothetical protein [Planctomycetota bacterium]